jgi:hypothetical protein
MPGGAAATHDLFEVAQLLHTSGDKFFNSEIDDPDLSLKNVKTPKLSSFCASKVST